MPYLYRINPFTGLADIVSAGAITAGSWGAPIAATLAAGVLTVTGPGVYAVSGQGGLADDLESISGGNTGDEIILYAADTAVTITVKDNTAIKIGADFLLDDTWDKIRLVKQADGKWTGGGLGDNA